MFVTDTHPLVWFATGKLSKLSDKVLTVFRRADRKETAIYIPTVVLLECAALENDGEIQFIGGFEKWSQALFKNPCFIIDEMTLSIISRSVGFTFNKDRFDRIVVASAVERDLPLITKDSKIIESKLVEIYW